MIPTESKIKALPVAARYIRVSTEDQTEYSPDAQNKALLRYANENRYQTDDRYLFIDEGISGRKAEKRPAFMQMITQAKSKEHPFDIILVHKFDRFARSREDSVVYKSLLRKECGVRVISVTESIEDDKFSIILESMLEAMAEYYSINLSEEVKKGMSEKAIRGGLQCAPAFGYEVKDHMLVPVSEKADLIREIFRQFVGGRGYYAIARWLNENGVTTNFGNKFESRSVEYIIRNPVYIGKLRWNPSGRSRRDFENENIILADGAHEALILDDIWNAAQKRVHEIKSQWKYHGRPPEKKSDWISGLVHCAACGSPLVFSKPHYWKCNAYAKGACTCSQHIRDDLLKDAIIKRLQHDTKTDISINYKLIGVPSGYLSNIELLQKKKFRLQDKIVRLREAFLSGVETLIEYKSTKSAIMQQLNQLENELHLLENSKPEDDSQTRIKRAMDSTIREFLLGESSIELKKAAVCAIIDKCVWDKSQNLLQIFYRSVFLS